MAELVVRAIAPICPRLSVKAGKYEMVQRVFEGVPLAGQGGVDQIHIGHAGRRGHGQGQAARQGQ